MKHVLSRVFALALCATVVSALPAFAAEGETTISEAPEYLTPVRVWGTVTWQENGAILLRNSNENDPYHEVILHLTETIPVVDAVTGLPLNRELRDGETVYAWIGPAVTMSLPPHAAAEAVVANIPEDFGAPQYYEIAGVERSYTTPTSSDFKPHLCEVAVTATDGQKLIVGDHAALFPYLTRQIVTLDSLIPGSRILVWSDCSGSVSKVMVFAYDYRGYISWEATGEVSVNSEKLKTAGKAVNGEALLPIRAVAEAAGYEVNWIPGQGAVVSQPGGGLVFSVLPGQDTATAADGETELTGTCYLENGTTYLPADDLAYLLNLFISR